MIHTATNTSKFKRLVRRVRALLGNLPIDPETICVGILERLWHTTISSAIRGDIGRLENEEIAEAVGWHGDADQIIQMLVDTEWLDECPEYRLLIHDWEQHAPKHVKGNVTKVGGFAIKAQPLRPSPNGHSLGGDTLATGASNVTKHNVTKPSTNVEVGAPTKRFSAPSIEEVKAYCQERKNSVDPDKFHSHYSANGWVQGRGKPIKDWKAAIRTWEGNDFSPRPVAKHNFKRREL